MDRENDFEGRCFKCKKNLDLNVAVVNKHKLILEVEPCKEHPDDSHILWPQRSDMVRKNTE